MADSSGEIFARVLVQTYTNYPQLVQNRTVIEVFTLIAQNETLLRSVETLTGVNATVIKSVMDAYVLVVTNLNAITQMTTGMSVNNTTNSTCSPIPGRGQFTNICLIPAMMIILLFSFLKQRRNIVNKCGVTFRRPGLCIPLNLLDSYENRFGFACAFGATVTKSLQILFLNDYSEIFDRDLESIQSDPATPAWSGIFWRILATIVIGVVYYPFFACLATDYTILGTTIGLLYSGLWLFVTIAQTIQCPERYISEAFPGDVLALEMPTYLCLAVLVIKYAIHLGFSLVKLYRRKRIVTTNEHEEEAWKESYKNKYVVKLLQPIPREHKEETRDKMKSRVYKWKPEFKYSTRVFCTYVVCFLVLYEVTTGMVVFGLVLYRYAQERIVIGDALKALGINIEQEDIRRDIFIALIAWYIAAGISFILCFVLIGNMLAWYRGHVARLQRGDKSFLPVKALTNAPPSITAATLKYSGYQVAYMAWGFVIMQVLLFIVGTVVGIQIIQPIVDTKLDSFVWTQFLVAWPAVLMSTLVFLVQMLLSRFVFLHDRGATLALDNRRIFHISTYFLFFFNIYLGVVSCLRRILIGAGIGVFFLARTQKSLVPRDYELNDPGFNAYVGYLYLEHTHSNPVLVTFCRLLVITFRGSHKTTDFSSLPDGSVASVTDTRSLSFSRTTSRRRRARTRWALFYTLTNNPSLCEDRRREMFVEKRPLQALRVMVSGLREGYDWLNDPVEHEEDKDDVTSKL